MDSIRTSGWSEGWGPTATGASSLWGVAQAEGPQGRLWTQELIDPLGSSSLSPRGLFFSPAVWLVGILVF